MPKLTKARTDGKPSTRFVIGRYDHSGLRPICSDITSNQIQKFLQAIPGTIAKFSGWEYPTDTEGLKLSEERTGEVITTLSIWLGLLGKVLVYADRDEITKDLDALGWVITGLSGLSQNLSEERAMIRFTLACPGGIRHD